MQGAAVTSAELGEYDQASDLLEKLTKAYVSTFKWISFF